MKSPTVFISYSHDSRQHADRVLALSNRLREEGIDCILDQYETSPPEEWPRWMDRHIKNSNFVIMICTETYCRRVTGEEEEGKGLGVKWEGNLIYQHIYNADTKNIRFFPMVFDTADVEWIPPPLQGATHYRLDEENGYEALYRRLTDQPSTIRPTLGKLRKLPPRERKEDFLSAQIAGLGKISLAKLPSISPDLFGREGKLAMLDSAWEDSQTNVVSLVAFGGVGKTALVNKWLLQMGEDSYRGAERVFGWSFYSQGAAEGRQVSADPFIAAALDWFGDPYPTKGSPWDKGERLAELVKKKRTLLVLDGLEPLQNPPPIETGRMKDPGLCCLLRELARHNPGLCIVTTRLPVDDLKDFVNTSMKRINLEDLSPQAGAALLEHLGAIGTSEELEEATAEFKGHALALTLLGRYLVDVHAGDIRKRDLIPKLAAEDTQGAHTQRMLAAYEKWFDGKPEQNILRIMGLFDRPADAGAIAVLRADPPIEKLTDKLKGFSHDEWQIALKHLRDARLLSQQDPAEPNALDAHPLVREYFGQQLQQEYPKAWREGHNRLYEHLKSSAKEFPETLEEMMPLYAAVAHGCQAGCHQKALDEVLVRRIQQGNDFFSTSRLGAIGADLAALSSFFDRPWHEPVAGLTEADESWVLSMAGFDLRALGRLAEAAQPMRASLEPAIAQEDWKNAAIRAENLSETYLTSGDLSQGLQYAEKGVEFADKSQEWTEQEDNRTVLANALHQAGRLSEAETAFREAEAMQREGQSEYPFLYGVSGYLYCDLLLGQGELQEVQIRVNQTLEWITPQDWLLDIGLDHLSLGRAYLLQAQREETGDPSTSLRTSFTQAADHLNQAVGGLRDAGTQHHIPRGLLARAGLHRVQGDFKQAKRDLDEAMTIATHGGMQLHKADCHLETARLYLAQRETDKARESLEKAKTMIEEMGYHRRDPEVLLVTAELQLLEGDKKAARKNLTAAKKMIDDMGCHRWDFEAAELEKRLQA